MSAALPVAVALPLAAAAGVVALRRWPNVREAVSLIEIGRAHV